MQSNATPTPTPSIPTAMANNSPPAVGDAVRVARWSQPDREGMDALNGGTLAIVNNCLVITNQGAPPILPIFPYGIGVWDDAKQTFTFEGKVIRIGETIQVGGGRIPDFEWLKETGKYYDPNCGITNLWLVARTIR
jgi:hypothetical protein